MIERGKGNIMTCCLTLIVIRQFASKIFGNIILIALVISKRLKVP